MDRWSLVFAAALFVSPLAVRADAGIALPLSDRDSRSLPPLDIARLTPRTGPAVKAAIAAAEHARRSADAAKRVIAAAMKASEKAGKARNYDSLDMPGADGTACLYQGRVTHRRATGLGVMHCRTQMFAGMFRDGRLNGLGGDTALIAADAYEGEYRDGMRMGFGIERDKDGFYPGRFGVRRGADGKKTDLEILGVQHFKNAQWAGHYGFYSGPKIACTLIKGAVLEGSVLDGYGAKFDARGHLIEQGFYKWGRPAGGSGPPC